MKIYNEKLLIIIKEYFSKQNNVSFVYLFNLYSNLEINYQDINIIIHFDNYDIKSSYKIKHFKNIFHYCNKLINFAYDLKKLLNHEINIYEIQDMNIYDQIKVINNGLKVYCNDEEELGNYIENLSKKACEIEDDRMFLNYID